jgi:single-strand DNA-binding protein
MINKVILIGRLGADPEIKETKKGESFANLSLATNKKFKDQEGNWSEKTTWHKVVVFDPRLAENMEKFAKKGTQLYCEGELETRQYKDLNGNNRIVTEVIVPRYTGSIRLMGEKSPAKTTQSSSTTTQSDSDFDDQF